MCELCDREAATGQGVTMQEILQLVVAKTADHEPQLKPIADFLAQGEEECLLFLQLMALLLLSVPTLQQAIDSEMSRIRVATVLEELHNQVTADPPDA